MALRHDEHVNVDILPVILRERSRRFFAVLAAFLMLLYCAIIASYAWLMVFDPAARNTVTPALKLPLWVVELAVPVGLSLMLLRALEILYRSARGRRAFVEAEDDEVGGASL